jgi:hypothetical protein
MVSLRALQWLWALNPSFPSAHIPQGLPVPTPLTPPAGADGETGTDEGQC